MIAYVEEHLADRVGGLGYLKLYVDDGSVLEEVSRARGYRKLRYSTPYLEYTIDELPAPELPQGFAIRSVAEEDDVDKRRRAKAIAFGGHYAPSDWAPAGVYREIQQAPDYCKYLDLFIVAPDGEYASFCTIWMDTKNRYGVFEPVGTHAEYQGQGLGRALLQEGFQRLTKYGATRSYMQSLIGFYRSIGFRETGYSTSTWIRYFPV